MSKLVILELIKRNPRFERNDITIPCSLNFCFQVTIKNTDGSTKSFIFDFTGYYIITKKGMNLYNLSLGILNLQFLVLVLTLEINLLALILYQGAMLIFCCYCLLRSAYCIASSPYKLSLLIIDNYWGNFEKQRAYTDPYVGMGHKVLPRSPL